MHSFVLPDVVEFRNLWNCELVHPTKASKHLPLLVVLGLFLVYHLILKVPRRHIGLDYVLKVAQLLLHLYLTLLPGSLHALVKECLA